MTLSGGSPTSGGNPALRTFTAGSSHGRTGRTQNTALETDQNARFTRVLTAQLSRSATSRTLTYKISVE